MKLEWLTLNGIPTMNSVWPLSDPKLNGGFSWFQNHYVVQDKLFSHSEQFSFGITQDFHFTQNMWPVHLYTVCKFKRKNYCTCSYTCSGFWFVKFVMYFTCITTIVYQVCASFEVFAGMNMMYDLKKKPVSMTGWKEKSHARLCTVVYSQFGLNPSEGERRVSIFGPLTVAMEVRWLKLHGDYCHCHGILPIHSHTLVVFMTLTCSQGHSDEGTPWN